MKWRIAKKLHKVAVAGLDPDEYRRRVPKDRERRATMGAWTAIGGQVLFALYPWWRKHYRSF